MPGIRNLALGLPVRDGHVLVHDGVEGGTGRTFHRALGGGIEFGETAERALRREFREELDVDLDEVRLLAVLESVFTFEGSAGHEIAHVFAVTSRALSAVPLTTTLTVLDEGSAVRWVPLDALAAPVYPEGCERLARELAVTGS